MDARNAVRELLELSERQGSAVSRELGLTKNYLSTMISRGSVPRLDTFVKVAEACGYRVVLQRDDGPAEDAITIEYH